MIIPKQKIQVFISSACGDEPEKQKYNYVREALKVIIESTGFAEAYVFETEGASSSSAEKHYTYALEDCDVCVFLVDNYDGVPTGVQKEVDAAKKHNIKSLFYFCDQTSTEKTPLQKSLLGAQHAKSETIHDLKDIIKNGASDLISDLVMVYKHYCKGRLTWLEEPQRIQSNDISNIGLPVYSDSIAQKDVLANIDGCIEYLTKLILEWPHDEVEKTEELDRLCAMFLPVLFEGAAFDKEIVGLLLLEIEKNQGSSHFAVTKKRYEAIEAYYSGDQETCIYMLNEAQQLAKQNSLPEWFAKDILIDLRNQDTFMQESRNTYLLERQYQNELDNSQYLLYYPLLDRLYSNYYEGIIEQDIKYKMQTPGTVTLGHGLGAHIKSLASIYILAMYNGSLSHLQLFYERIKYLAFYCASRYSDWSIKKLLLKTTIINGNRKEIDGIVRRFGDLLSKMNENDAYEIYSFSDNRPLPHQSLITKLEALRITGYYMSDERFRLIWAELYAHISLWIEDEKSTVVIGYHIFPALEEIHLRIPQDQLIEIVCKSIANSKRRFYDEIFSLVRKCINIGQASPEKSDELLEAIIGIVRNPDERKNINTLGTALVTIRKKHRELTEALDKVISEEMPDFYRGIYRLETTIEENTDMPEFVETYLAQIISDNETQGKGGRYLGRGNQPHITIKNIIKQSKAEFSESLIDSVFKASCDTLLCDNQTIEAKIDAVDLLVWLLKSQSDTLSRNRGLINNLLLNKPTVETACSIISNLSETNLKLSVLLLYHCLGENIIVSLLEILADIADDALSNRKASTAFLNYLEVDTSPISDIQVEHIILQQAIEWCVESDLETRWNAVQILFSLLRNLANKNIVCNQLVKLMDTDNVYIKNKILRSAYILKDIDDETFKYIIQKASIDTNYVTRMVAREVRDKMELSDITTLV